MNEWIRKNRKIIIAAILLLAVVLVFFRLTRADIQTDAATYSFRALHYFDYMDTTVRQTTPFQWYEEGAPFWINLSFHDAPPLAFIIQFVFFKIFGVSTLVTLLPFALAGFGSIVLLYFIGRKLYGETAGLLAAFILAISSYHIWASRVGYLEILVTFFILLTIYLFFVTILTFLF